MKRGIARGALALFLALLLGIGWLTWRALSIPSRQLEAEALDDAPVDAARVADALARVIRIRTISESREAPVAADAFRALHRELERLFPRIHSGAGLERERIADWSLLYTWRGSDPELEPLLLVAHTDVVPIDPGTENAWKQAPFSGAVVDGEVWGRGAIDDKGSLIATLAAVEDLLAERFTPKRTLLLALGHDEEIGGNAGARAIATTLEARGVRAALVLDEGGVVSEDMIPDLGPIALVGVAEKGSVSLALTVEAPGGHSSVPPRQSAIGIASEAVRALETQHPSARLVETTRATFAALAPELSFPARLVLANADVLARPLLRVLASNAALDAAIRTTTAPTVFHGGAKSNVLPKRVTAVVNFRIIPGETVEDVVAHARATIADDRVHIDIARGTPAREPSAESPTDGPAFALLQKTIAARFPEALVAPYLVLGGTDARHYGVISENVYRFLPLRLNPESRTRMHGTDERLDVDELANAVRFYRELIRRAQQPL
jgi:carboxypeptidase PM20D1